MRTFLIALALLLASSSAHAEKKTVGTKSFSFPVPDGYDDDTGEAQADRGTDELAAVMARKATRGVTPYIMVQVAHAQVHTADEQSCALAAAGLADPGKSKVTHTAMIAGPLGPACQMELVNTANKPPIAATIVELDAPHATILMTCNHAVGDATAVKVCQATLAGFKLK